MRQDVRRVERAQQALFALVDSLAKVSLPVCQSRVARQWRQHSDEARNGATPGCSQSAGQAILSDSILAMEDLMSRGQTIKTTSASFGCGHGSRQRRAERRVYASAYSIIMHHARMSGAEGGE